MPKPRGLAHLSSSVSVAENCDFGYLPGSQARVRMVVVPGGAACPHQKQLVCPGQRPLALPQPGRTFPNSWPRGFLPPPLPRWKLPQVVLGLMLSLPKALAKDRSPAGETSCCVWVSCGSCVSPVPLRRCLVAQRPRQECKVHAGVEGGEWRRRIHQPAHAGSQGQGTGPGEP